MDVNATLTEIRAIATEPTTDPLHDRLVDLVTGLDQWLTSGGFLPDEWERGR